EYLELTINTRTTSLEEASTMFLQRWAIFIFVLVVLVISVMAGVFNTLLNNVMAKRKEYAVLRTIGVRPGGIMKIVVTQISFYLVAGIVFGLACGLVFSLIISLIDPGTLAIHLPLILGLAGAMWLIGLLLFVPIGWK